MSGYRRDDGDARVEGTIVASAEEGFDAGAGSVKAVAGFFVCAAEDTAAAVVVHVWALTGEKICSHCCVF